MTDNNTMGKIEYVFNNAFWIFVIMAWFRPLLFVPLDNLTVADSKKIMWALIVALVALGVLITFKKRRNYLSLTINILFPLEIYALVAYFNFFNMWIKITVIVAITLTLLFFLISFFGGSSRSRKLSMVKKRVKHALLGARVIAVLCLSAFVVPLGVNAFVGRDLYQADNGDLIVDLNSDEWTISNNLDTIMKLSSSTWETLSVKERLDVLSVLKNIEARYLGITHEIYLSADNLEEGTLGSYFPNERKIVIDVTHLKNGDSYDVVHTLAHECHHAYSRQQVEAYKKIPDEYKNMLMFRDIKTYEREYADYIDSDEDYYGYYNQFCEQNANLYATEAAEGYFDAILSYQLCLISSSEEKGE